MGVLEQGWHVPPLRMQMKKMLKPHFRILFLLTLAFGAFISSAALSDDADNEYAIGAHHDTGEPEGDTALPEDEQDDEEYYAQRAAEEAVQQRTAIIELVEDELSSAYSFNSKSDYPVPFYEKLDEIYPTWHHGEPAAARQFWLTLDFHAHLVQYRVDYIYKVNDFTAVAGGKRLVVWTRDERSSIIEKEFWPFQYWANLTQHKNAKCVKCIDVTYASVFELRLSLDENGKWTVIKEKLTEQPEIPNTWEEDCGMQKFLEDWGFISVCGKKKSSMF
ncbi:MAG: hypothetical protein JXX14_15110 [Deltaproteobacteria bacterium]|nr:hypothetical protein [Deltaproteobacteria bacterium]